MIFPKNIPSRASVCRGLHLGGNLVHSISWKVSELRKCGMWCWRRRQEQNILDLLGRIKDVHLYPEHIWKWFSHFRQRNDMIRLVLKRDHYVICVGQMGIRSNAYFLQVTLPKVQWNIMEAWNKEEAVDDLEEFLEGAMERVWCIVEWLCISRMWTWTAREEWFWSRGETWVHY